MQSTEILHHVGAVSLAYTQASSVARKGLASIFPGLYASPVGALKQLLLLLDLQGCPNTLHHYIHVASLAANRIWTMLPSWWIEFFPHTPNQVTR